MSVNNIDYQTLNKKFEDIEGKIKEKVRTINERDPFSSIIPAVVDSISTLTKDTFDNVNLFSISFLIDDIFIITFPESEDYSIWNTYSLFDEGSIGNQCRKALQTKEKVTAYSNKIEIITQDKLTQRKVFLSEQCNVEAHFVSPLIIHETIIGRIQLSFTKDANDAQKKDIINYLTWLNDKIIWIIYSEFIRVNNIIKNLNSIVDVLLGDIDEYQATHSQKVSRLAKVLATIIVKDKNSDYEFTYKKMLGCNLDGVDILKLQVAGLLHDIGKVKMWSFDKFNSELEMRKRNLHPFFSYSIINKMQFSEEVAEIAGFHHECINGNGEPFAVGNGSMNIVTQLIKCADIIDASLRKRPHSGKDKPANNNGNQGLDTAIRALTAHKNDISCNVYKTVIAILSDIKDEEKEKEKDKYKVRELLRIDSEMSKQINVSVHSNIDIYLNEYLNNLDWNKWVVVFAFNCESINQYSYTKDKNEKKVLFFKNQEIKDIVPRNKSDFVVPFVPLQDNIYLGIYNEEENKEYAYSFCESLDKYLDTDNNLVCAFLSHSIIHMDSFQEILDECIDKLKRTCINMNAHSRWQLLRFDTNKKEWK